MATKILVIVLIITSVVAYTTNARSLTATEVKAAADVQKEDFGHPLPPYFGGFGGLRGGIRPTFGLGAGIGGTFSPFVGGGGTGSGFGGNYPNNGNCALGAAGDMGEGGDAAIGHDMP